jgi:hypothetical protein
MLKRDSRMRKLSLSMTRSDRMLRLKISRTNWMELMLSSMLTNKK